MILLRFGGVLMFAPSTTDSVASQLHYLLHTKHLMLQRGEIQITEVPVHTQATQAIHNTFIMLSNNVTLIGNLGSDLNMRKIPSGQSVASVNIAINRSYTRNNEEVKETQWFRLNIWGDLAERMAKDVSKGSRVLVEGRLTSRTYETKDGQKKEAVEIVVSNYQKLERSVSAEVSPETEEIPIF